MGEENEFSAGQVESPCISVCVLGVEDICEGCFRSAEEIAQWSSYDNAQKREVIRLSWERARAANRLL